MDHWLLTTMFLKGTRDLLTFHTILLIKAIIGVIIVYWVLAKA